MFRILGLSGSLRRDSHNTRLLAFAATRLPADALYQRYDGLKSIAPFDEDDEDTPPQPVEQLRDALRWADGLLISTPEYNASVPGQLKNAVDWASRPVATAALRDLCVGVLGASTSSFGAVWAQAHLRGALGAAGARVIGLEAAVAEAHEQFAPDGRLLDPDATRQVDAVVAALMDEVRASAASRVDHADSPLATCIHPPA